MKCLECFKYLYPGLSGKFTLWGDNSFYSFREELGENYTYENLKNFKTDKIDISKKTGLGSSAAMVVSLTCAAYLAQNSYVHLEDTELSEGVKAKVHQNA